MFSRLGLEGSICQTRQGKCCYMDSYILLTLMESPVVSEVQNYKELGIAAKREEQRLAELKRKQQYL